MRRWKTTISLLALSVFAGSLPAQEFQLRTRVDLVVVPFQVRGADGELITGLDRDDFVVLEDGREQTIDQFSIDPVPLSAALVIDTGMEAKSLATVQEAVPSLAAAFGAFDKVALFRYDDRVTRMLDFTDDSDELYAALSLLRDLNPTSQTAGGFPGPPGLTVNGRQLVPRAGTSRQRDARVLHDAMYLAMGELRDEPENMRKVVLLITDGNDRASIHRLQDNVMRLINSEVEVYVLRLAADVFERMRPTDLDDYSNYSGGDFRDVGNSSLASVFFDVTEQARNQYVLAYVSNNLAPPDKIVFRNIEVRCPEGRNYDIVHKRGYYQAP